MADIVEVVDITPKVNKTALAKVHKDIQEASGPSVGAMASNQLGRTATNLLNVAGGTFGNVGSAALSGAATGGPWGAVISAGSAAIEGIFEKAMSFFKQIPGLVGKASPATLKRFLDVFDDIEAVVGHRLVPVLDAWTDEIRLLGDFLQSILPDTKDFKDLVDAWRPILKEARQILTDLAPTMKLVFTVILKYATERMKEFAKAIEILSAVVQSSPLYQLISKVGGEKKDLSSSFGAAAGSGSIVSGQELHRRTVIAALSTGMSPEEKTAENTKEANGYLAKIAEAVVKAPFDGVRGAQSLTNPRDIAEHIVSWVSN